MLWRPSNILCGSLFQRINSPNGKFIGVFSIIQLLSSLVFRIGSLEVYILVEQSICYKFDYHSCRFQVLLVELQYALASFHFQLTNFSIRLCFFFFKFIHTWNSFFDIRFSNAHKLRELQRKHCFLGYCSHIIARLA